MRDPIVEALVEWAPLYNDMNNSVGALARAILAAASQPPSTACASTPTPKASEDAREHTGEDWRGALKRLYGAAIGSPAYPSHGWAERATDDFLSLHTRLRPSQPEPHTPSGDADSSCNEAQIAMSAMSTKEYRAWMYGDFPSAQPTDSTPEHEVVGLVIQDGDQTRVISPDSTPEGREPQAWVDHVKRIVGACRYGRRWCDVCESWDHECGCKPNVGARTTARVLALLSAIGTPGPDREAEAWEEGSEAGYDTGRRDGYAEGHKAGYAAGLADREAAIRREERERSSGIVRQVFKEVMQMPGITPYMTIEKAILSRITEEAHDA